MRIIIIKSLLILLIPNLLGANQNEFDSLLNLSKEIGLSNVEESIQLAKQARELAINASVKRNQAEANRQLIYLYLCLGNFEKTRAILDESGKLYKELGDQKGAASVLGGYGDIALYEVKILNQVRTFTRP